MEFNKEAIAARGWCPLMQKLLDHPEIIATAEPTGRNSLLIKANIIIHCFHPTLQEWPGKHSHG
jgi:hypothetical protein